MQFNTKGHDIFRRWYVDGRIYYQKIIDRENPKEGIKELKYIDPRKIKKVREDKKRSELIWEQWILLRYTRILYSMKEVLRLQQLAQGIRIAADTIAFCGSG
jgi:hypothetical protein